MKKRRKRRVILCNCGCPFWQKRHKNLWVVECKCGNKGTACGYCLVAGRLTECPECARRNFRTGAGVN